LKVNLLQNNNNHLDIDYFGVVGIRFTNVTEKEVRSIINGYSLFKSELKREPEIIIRFVDKLKTPNLIFLGLDFAAFDVNNFYLIADPIEKKKVNIPFDKIGRKLEIVCEKGVKSVPLLNHIINFYLVKNNYVPIHSSGFYFDQKGILVMGWTKGGKTETLLSFANHGAEYVGDEWVVLTPDGSEMSGLHVPITIWKWQLSYVKKIVGNIGLANRIVFAFISLLEIISNLSVKLKLNTTFPFKVLNQAMPHIRKLLRIRKTPGDIFKNKIRIGMTKLEVIVLAMSHESNDITINECEPEEIINRMIHSNDYEQLPFFELYKAYKFAFPEKRNEFLDNIKNIHSRLLLNTLQKKKAFKISHPYPVSFEVLFSTLHSALLN
jgi:hypothetical protein